MKFALACLLALTGAFASCERVDVTGQSTVPPGPQSHNMGLSGHANPTPTLFDRIANSRETNRFQGVRHVELFFEDGPQQRHPLIRERVSADGQGAYAIEALEIVEPQMTADQRALFLTLQSLRQGMNWRYRDFGIHDVPLFLQNYRAVDTGMQVDVAQRQCMVLAVERTDQSGSVYSIAVDNLTGLVLSSSESTHEGVIVSEMSYESIDLSPDLSGVAWHQSLNNELSLPLSGSLSPTVGFEVRAPLLLPPGYQLLERSSLFVPQDGSTWVKATYGDGIENLFFLDGGPIVGDNGIRSGVPEIQADLVEVTAAPPWTVARGNLRADRVIALGKVGEQDLLALLRSAME